MHKRFFWMFIGCALAMLTFGSALAQEALPALDDLDAETWTDIPLADAVCARGTPYQFFVRPADPSKLMIYFQGGGACWNGQTCGVGGPFDDSVGSSAEEVGMYDGVFSYDNADNPVADYSVVFIPYCTADVHTGSNEVEFSADLTIQYNGFVNASQVLDWVYANYDPEQIIITGSSAGAYGAVLHAPYILMQYPEADAFMLGDAGVGVTASGWDGLETWGTLTNVPDEPAFADLTPQNFNNGLYTGLATLFPDARVAQYSTFGDTTQLGFYGFQGGNFLDWSARALGQLQALTEAVPNFNAYWAWGDSHTILATPLFYTMQVDGVRFRDWFAALAVGEPVENVFCTDCTEEELYTP